jgi:hypothetical protein
MARAKTHQTLPLRLLSIQNLTSQYMMRVLRTLSLPPLQSTNKTLPLVSCRTIRSISLAYIWRSVLWHTFRDVTKRYHILSVTHRCKTLIACYRTMRRLAKAGPTRWPLASQCCFTAGLSIFLKLISKMGATIDCRVNACSVIHQYTLSYVQLESYSLTAIVVVICFLNCRLNL